jgi:hypothetical protein
MNDIDNSYKKMNSRMIKAIAIAMASFEEKTKQQVLNDCDFNRVRSYRCIGDELIGSSVIGFSSGTHFLAASREYEVYEIPFKSNSKEHVEHGRFIVLLKDISFEYWMLASLNYTCRSEKHKIGTKFIDSFCEKASYDLLSQAVITQKKACISAKCTISTKDLKFDIQPEFEKVEFDWCDSRKKAVYGFTKQKLMRKLGFKEL